jgi:hypothetical protein
MNMPPFRSFERAQGPAARCFDIDDGDDMDDMEDAGPGTGGRWRGFPARSTRWGSMNPRGFSTDGGRRASMGRRLFLYGGWY